MLRKHRLQFFMKNPLELSKKSHPITQAFVQFSSLKLPAFLIMNDDFRSDYRNDYDLASGLSLVIAEHCTDIFGELSGIRNKYKITRWEDYYRLLFKPYYESIFRTKDQMEY